tara:strand:- start:7117 stop:8607 length:1491 start_codon:yes stop_codon:yes gene_type:complete
VKDNSSLSDIMNHRIEKLDKIKDSNVPSFDYSFKTSVKIGQILSNQKEWLDKEVKICGRIVSLRKMGKACFVHIQSSDDKIQLYVRTDNLPEKIYDSIARNLDIGDIIGVTGEVFLTKTEELSIKATLLTILSKNIRPLPNLKEKDGETFFSFNDKELRYRNRHLDLITNPETRNVFISRAAVIKKTREILDNRGFLEVETPCLQPLYGGASAQPFKTHHNTLDRDLFLRIASELYLKRLIVGGLDKVYELGKNFRNEGMDRSHNPEFTMLEFYEAYSDISDMITITEIIFKEIANTFSKTHFNFNNHTIDLISPFNILTMKELFEKHAKVNPIELKDTDLDNFAIKHGIDKEKYPHRGKIVEKLFSNLVEPYLIQPTFVTEYPVEISPLARYKRGDDSNQYVERFELFISGLEFANSFSELNDPFEQKNRLLNQQKMLQKGDAEAQVFDKDFIEVLEAGMPPTGGVGIGIDRMVMLFTEQDSIKDVIFFPSMRDE